MKRDRMRLRISFNAPATLVFSLICAGAQLINILTGGWSNDHIFSVYRSSLLDPLAYLRFFCHVFGHSGWDHLINNLMYVLILGPMLEEKYGTENVVIVMAATALVTGILHPLLFPGVRLLGASGIVFAFILLSSITRSGDGSIPVTFLLVAALYLGTQIYEGIALRDHVSQMSHIVGGIVGTVLGFAMDRSGFGKRR